MKKILLILSLGLLTGATEARARQCKDIHIPRGRISTAVKGVTTKGYACYRIRARYGQKITLHLASPDRHVTFSLTEDYYDADFTAEDVRDWEGGVGNVDAYLISVGGGKRGSPFTFEVTIR
jgi:hypothetical protein